MHRPVVGPSLSFTQGTGEARYSSDEAHLKQLARQFVEDYPDVHGMAYAEARTLLFKHTGKQLDPEKVFWHRFHTAASSPRTFTGWEHSGRPYESMTFVELLLRRFTAHDQLASDELQLYGGFYTDGSAYGTYDERNEIALLPMQAMNDFWALDFNALFEARMAAFWALHGGNFCTLARSRFLAAAGVQLRRGRLTLAQFKLLTGAVVGKLQPVMTLSALQTTVTPPRGMSLHSFDIGGLECSEAFRVVSVHGWQILYLPSDDQPVHVFASDQELYRWVQHRLRQASSRPMFEAFFLRTDAQRQLHQGAFSAHAQLILDTPWVAGQALINANSGQRITGDVFEYLRDHAKQQLQSDAHVLMTSNTDLRKRMWMGYLDAFMNVFGGFAPLGWPMALTLVGAGVANVTLRVDQAITGKNAQERKAGLIGAIFNTIYLAFNLSVLIGMSRIASARGLDKPANVLPPASENTSTMTAHESIPMADLSGLEGNVILSPETPGSLGRMRGVQRLVSGETWINLNDMPFRVVFNDPLDSWIIVDPFNPATTGGARPVRLNARQEWELVGQPQAQAGISPSPTIGDVLSVKPYATIRSSFWDIYMQFNLPEEERLSELGMARQESVINLRESQPNDLLLQSATGNPVLIDGSGDQHWVFKGADGSYVGGRIAAYSVKDSAFNKFLRTGESRGVGQVDLIEELADDLLSVGPNNDVSLYRGGSYLRGTSGSFFRSGHIKAGDVLVNTDISSFSENPFTARVFCSSQAGENSADFAALGDQVRFDDTAIVFELPAKKYLNATPVALFSGNPQETESIFMPGHYFLIDNIQEVAGLNYKFMKVQLSEISQPKAWHTLYDLRTGELFSREQYAARLGEEGKPLVDRFFPISAAASTP